MVYLTTQWIFVKLCCFRTLLRFRSNYWNGSEITEIGLIQYWNGLFLGWQLWDPRMMASSMEMEQSKEELDAGPTVIEKQVQKRIFKIIVIGDSNVGKTCLTFRFCGGKFPEKTEATIGVDFRENTVQVEGETVKVYLTSRQALEISSFLFMFFHPKPRVNCQTQCQTLCLSDLVVCQRKTPTNFHWHNFVNLPPLEVRPGLCLPKRNMILC